MKLPFHRKAEEPVCRYDPQRVTPVLQCSICTGEQTLGFQDNQTKKIQLICSVKSGKELDELRARYGITGEIRKIY